MRERKKPSRRRIIESVYGVDPEPKVVLKGLRLTEMTRVFITLELDDQWMDKYFMIRFCGEDVRGEKEPHDVPFRGVDDSIELQDLPSLWVTTRTLSYVVQDPLNGFDLESLAHILFGEVINRYAKIRIELKGGGYVGFRVTIHGRSYTTSCRLSELSGFVERV